MLYNELSVSVLILKINFLLTTSPLLIKKCLFLKPHWIVSHFRLDVAFVIHLFDTLISRPAMLLYHK